MGGLACTLLAQQTRYRGPPGSHKGEDAGASAHVQHEHLLCARRALQPNHARYGALIGRVALHVLHHVEVPARHMRVPRPAGSASSGRPVQLAPVLAQPHLHGVALLGHTGQVPEAAVNCKSYGCLSGAREALYVCM